MAQVKTIKRHSEKKYKKKKPTKKRATTKKTTSKTIVPRRKKKTYPSHEKKLVYTYVLKDIKRNIYKIGKTADPHARFKSLCVPGKVLPIALVKKDVEDILHKEYAENRIFNEEYRMNGATEWFKPGGKFDKFIATVDKGIFLPYITIHTMTKTLIENNVIRLNDSNTEWELAQSTFGYYFIGLEILKMLGYVKKAGKIILSGDVDNILLIGRRISVSEEVIENIKKNYIVFISHTVKSGIIQENRSTDKIKSRLRKVTIETKEFDSEMFLLLNKVLS